MLCLVLTLFPNFLSDDYDAGFRFAKIYNQTQFLSSLGISLFCNLNTDKTKFSTLHSFPIDSESELTI